MPPDASVEHVNGINGNAWNSLHAEDGLATVENVKARAFVIAVPIAAYSGQCFFGLESVKIYEAACMLEQAQTLPLDDNQYFVGRHLRYWSSGSSTSNPVGV